MADYTTGTPKTIEELKDYCNNNGYTASKTRFYIGTNYQCAKAFGIYKDEETGEFVVYKNKADGSRSIRYKGYDEAYAVNELYQRLLEEVGNQIYHYNLDKSTVESSRSSFERLDNYERINQSRNGRSRSTDSFDVYSGFGGGHSSSAFNVITLFVAIALIIIAFNIFASSTSSSSRSGGTRHNTYNSYNYNHNNSWYNDDYNYNNSHSSWDNDWDSGWSSDDWDSGYTDWDSDW